MELECILEVVTTEFPDILDVKQENEKNQDDSKILVSVMERMECLQLT